MKRRVPSFIIVLTLCLNLFPVEAFAAGAETGDGLCPHHTAHTDACGYASPVLGRECTHSHNDGCYLTQTNCIHTHTAECYPDLGDASGGDEPSVCTHTCTQDSGCVTRALACPHVHNDACGYVEGEPGAPCTFVCRLCPLEELLGALPGSVSADNSERVGAQLGEIFDLYDALTEEEQEQVDLSPCAALMDQLEGLGAGELSDNSKSQQILTKDETVNAPLTVSQTTLYDTGSGDYTRTNNGTGSDPTAILVTGTGNLELQGTGKVVSQKGIGVKVESGGTLTVIGNTRITGQTYALYIASGAKVQLSAGTYTGGQFSESAIYVNDGNYAALLAEGFAFFDESGNALSPADLANAKTLTVKQCTNHQKTYAHDSGTPTHTWTCAYCGTTGTEKCSFTFAQDGTGTCGQEGCGNGLTIVVDEDDLSGLVYDGTVKPEEVEVTVTLTGPDGNNAATLTKGTDFSVDIEKLTNAGQAKVTVTGITFNGTFIKTYTVEKAEPKIEWSSITCSVDYDGKEVDNLPSVAITAVAGDDLSSNVRYAYKKTAARTLQTVFRQTPGPIRSRRTWRRAITTKRWRRPSF